MIKQATLGAGTIAVGVIAAVAALILFASAALAANVVSTSDQPTGAAGSQVTVPIVATTDAAVGNYTIEVSWEAGAAVVGNPTCTSNPAGSCQVAPGGEAGVVRFAGATGDPAGLASPVAIGSLTFTMGPVPGECSTLSVEVVRLDDANGEPLSASGSGTSLCVAITVEETPTPVPSASATAAPTASPTVTPGSVPQTGGDPGSSTSNMVWLLAAAGLAIVAGGAWAVARARRI